jgi:hypothetical protein
MPRIAGSTFTPVYVKTDENASWPEDPVFFMLSRDGLHLCRNHRFFRSSVPAPYAPSELASQKPFLDLNACPLIPQALIERAVGFFYEVYRRSGSESGLLLVFNDDDSRMRLVCPDQVATVSVSYYGDRYPLNLKYTIPGDLRRGDLLLGDLHSHANEAAYASYTDKADEAVRTGIHVVVGRLGALTFGRAPEFHVDVVADGTRFGVHPAESMFEGYREPDDAFPRSWLKRVRVKRAGWSGADRECFKEAPHRNPDPDN